jgi:hypothetical protein
LGQAGFLPKPADNGPKGDALAFFIHVQILRGAT